jgi:hypothetical protein
MNNRIAVKPAQTYAGHGHVTAVRTFDVDAELPHGLHRGEAVLAVEKPCDVRHAFGDRTEQQRAMRD